jgi:hypothetical protein
MTYTVTLFLKFKNMTHMVPIWWYRHVVMCKPTYAKLHRASKSGLKMTHDDEAQGWLAIEGNILVHVANGNLYSLYTNSA